MVVADRVGQELAVTASGAWTENQGEARQASPNFSQGIHSGLPPVS